MKWKLIPAFLLSVLYGGAAVCQTVSFSKPHGVYDTHFPLKLTCPEDPGATILYTLDGSTPNAGSTVFDASFRVKNTTVVRAVAVPSGTDPADWTFSPENVATSTYILIESVMSQSEKPAGYPSTWGSFAQMSGTAPADYGMDSELLADDEFRDKAEKGLWQLPVVSIVSDKGNFFNEEADEETGGIFIHTGAPAGSQTGRGWERPASFELFGGETGHDLQINCGIKLHGGHSRMPEKSPKHSMRLMFKEKYGPKKLKYDLYGTEGAQKFDNIIIRSFFGNSWQHWSESNRTIAQYARDLWARTTQQKLGWPASRGQYVHVFINGMYWGMYNLTERLDDEYCQHTFGGSAEDYDIYKDNVLFRGNKVMWNRMTATADSVKRYASDFKDYDTSNSIYRRLDGLIDIDNFIDYMIINQFGGNTDWDYHNWVAIVNRKNPGAGFRFFCWDTEMIFQGIDDNQLRPSSSGKITEIFNNLRKNKVFLHRYIDRVYSLTHGNGLLTPDSVTAIWNSLYEQIDMAIYDESARWGDYRRDVHQYSSKGSLFTPDTYFQTERKRLLNEYFPKRPGKLISQLKAEGWYPKTDAPAILVNGSDSYEWTAAYGDTLGTGDALTISTSVKGTVYYTLDGSDPVSWYDSPDGKAAGSVYKAGTDLTASVFHDPDYPYTTFILKTASLSSSGEWSPTHTRILVAENPLLSTVTASPAHQGVSVSGGKILVDGHPAVRVTSLSGITVPNSNLAAGIYMADGHKVVVE